MTFVNTNFQNLSPELKADVNNGMFCVAIGYSAGGFEALRELFANLAPVSNNFIIILSQALEDSEVSILESQLFEKPLLRICRPCQGDNFNPGVIYAAKPGEVIRVADNKVSLKYGHPATEGLPADSLFLSLAVSAVSYKNIAVILSGTGNDGAAGVKTIKAAGGLVLAQRPETSKYDGMPKAAIGTGCADSITDPAQIGKMITLAINQQPLPLKNDAGDLVSQQAKVVSMSLSLSARSIENLVKETLYASCQHSFIIINKNCQILEISGVAAMFLHHKPDYLPCNLYDVLHDELKTDVRIALDNAINHGVLNTGKLEIFELEDEIVFVRVIVNQVQKENDGEELFVIIFENLYPNSFTAKTMNASGKLINGAEFQQLAKRILSDARTGHLPT